MNMASPTWGSMAPPAPMTAVDAIAQTSIPQVWGAALSEMGRGQDSMVAHVTPGEMTVPSEVLDRFPELQTALNAAFSSMGANPQEFVIGSPEQKINPVTGQPEFGFFKKIFKAVKPILPVAAAFIPGIGPVAAAAIGAGIGAIGGGGVQGAIGGALAGYGGSALASGLASAGSIPAAGIVGPQAGGVTGGISNLISGAPGAWGALSSSILGGGGLSLSNVGSLASLALASGAITGGSTSAEKEKAVSASTGGIPGSTPLVPLNPVSAAPASPGATPAETPKGSGALPGSPGIAGLLPQGVTFLQQTKNRDTGQVDYSEAPFSNSMSAVRRGNWGGSLLQV